MRIKLIIAAAAATALSGCLALPGSEYDTSGQGYAYGGGYDASCVSPCPTGYEVAGHGYTTAPVATYTPAAPVHHAHGAHHQAHAPVQPAPHAYGHAAHTTPYAAHHGLRGAHAPRAPYMYGSLGVVNYDTESDLYGLQTRLGYQSASILGAELEGSLGLTDEDDVEPGLTTSTQIDNQIAGFATARVPVASRVNLLGRLGYHNTQFGFDLTDTVTNAETELNTSFDGLAYGAGVEYALNPLTTLRGDYTAYELGDGAGTLDALSLGVARKF